MSSSMSCCLSVDLFSGLFSRCDTSQCCCPCCCSPFRPRYKRLVDNIFPPNYQDGLVKSNMEKLIFYAMSSPEKLDRIGAYLAERINRDLSRHRFGFVVIAIDAMDQLLVTCHSLNLFVQSYLKVVQLVLESQDADLQVLATSSFVKFANIEEDTPSYHRSYDFFVCKFSSLCHSNNADLKKRKQLRSAGLNGIKGLIRKTVSDDLQVQTDIWSEVHMEKIIPSLLFNMQCKDFEDIPRGGEGAKGSSAMLAEPQCTVDRAGGEQQLPQVQAEECLRELIARATFGHVHTILKPIIKHLDAHRLWEATVAEPSDKFAINSFKIIMYSIQTQHSYTVVQLLMNHLDSISNDRTGAVVTFEEETSATANGNGKADALNGGSGGGVNHSGENRIKVKTGIVNVLNEIISISVAQSIGPSVLGIISSLILHLRDSIHNINMKKYVEEERLFQEAVINTLGEFAANLPDYQKIETMIFIIDKAPPVSATSATDIQLQNIILKSLLKVTTKYKPVSMMQTFPSSLLHQLLNRALAPDPKARLTVQKIFHQLLDRHSNLSRLSCPVTIKAPEQLTIEKADRFDLNFIKRHAHDILVHIYNNVQIGSNTVENFASIYTTMALICIEMNSEEVLIDLIRLTFAIQELATSKSATLSDAHRCSLHSLVASFLTLFSNLKAIPAICSHVEQVVKMRMLQAKHLLPEFSNLIDSLQGEVLPEGKLMGGGGGVEGDLHHQDSVENLASSSSSISELLFNRSVISEALQTTGHDISTISTPFLSNSEVDSSMTRSISDLNAITLEIDSVNSSPGVGRARKVPEQEITFSTFKAILTNASSDKVQEGRRRLFVLNQFRNSKFEDLVNSYQSPSECLFDKLLSSIDKSFSAVEQAKSISGALDSSTINGDKETDGEGKRALMKAHWSSTTTAATTTTRADSPDESNSLSSTWHIYDNPFLAHCDVAEINSRGPPLFALRFPELFVF